MPNSRKESSSALRSWIVWMGSPRVVRAFAGDGEFEGGECVVR